MAAVAVLAACTKEPTGQCAQHAPGVRTPNTDSMVVTLDVSRLSGWLNARASCRVAPRHMEGDTGGGRCEGAWGWRWRCTQRARRNRLDAGHGTRAGVRTQNMDSMSVTLDVSRLSGWLNALANCRVALRHMEGDTGD